MTTTIINKNKKPNVPNSTDKGNVIRNVPHLRFPEFEGEWNLSKISDVLSIGNGRDYKNLAKGDIPVFGTGGYMTSVSDYLYDGETAFIGRKGTINKPYFYKGKFWTVDTLFYTHSFNGVTPHFVYCLFQTINWLRYNEASGVPSLSKDTIEKIKVHIPQIEEQQKISLLLFLLDERIATQSKIIEDLKKLKSAISKKLLCNDKWTTYKIQDIAEIGRGRVISSVEIDRQKHPLYPVYSSQTSNDGIMGYLDNYMFDGEYITWTTDGANAGTVFYRKGKFNCTNVCGTLKIQPKFDCYFVSLVLQQATQKYVSSNLANPKLMNNTMASIKIRMPNIETQKQLSKVFQALDGCLLIHQRTCEMYLKEKQYLLRQMFI